MAINRNLLAAGMAAAALSGGAATAATLGVDFLPGAVGMNSGCCASSYTLGYAFEDLTATSVVGLGVWAQGGAGEVGLWDAGGNLLATANVPGVLVGAAPWYFTAISPVPLTPGDVYYVGAYTDGGYAFDVNPVVVAPQISYLHNAWAFGGLNFPGNISPSFAEHGFFGGNVELSSVPEPATWGVMVAGMAGAGAVMRRRRRAAAVA
jgi:hypothetical protein